MKINEDHKKPVSLAIKEPYDFDQIPPIQLKTNVWTEIKIDEVFDEEEKEGFFKRNHPWFSLNGVLISFLLLFSLIIIYEQEKTRSLEFSFILLCSFSFFVSCFFWLCYDLYYHGYIKFGPPENINLPIQDENIGYFLNQEEKKFLNELEVYEVLLNEGLITQKTFSNSETFETRDLYQKWRSLVHKLTKEYPHKCPHCGDEILFEIAWDHAQETFTLKQFITIWKGNKGNLRDKFKNLDFEIPIYCCSCFKRF